jgi:hypothetical protein
MLLSNFQAKFLKSCQLLIGEISANSETSTFSKYLDIIDSYVHSKRFTVVNFCIIDFHSAQEFRVKAYTSNMVDHVLLSTIEDVFDIFVLVTIPVYIMIIITIAKNRKDEVLRHAFFDLMISLGVSDLGHTLWTIVASTLPRKGWVPQFYIWLGTDLSARLSYAGIFSLSGAQLFGVFGVALNRFTTYALPTRHDGVSLYFAMI